MKRWSSWLKFFQKLRQFIKLFSFVNKRNLFFLSLLFVDRSPNKNSTKLIFHFQFLNCVRLCGMIYICLTTLPRIRVSPGVNWSFLECAQSVICCLLLWSNKRSMSTCNKNKNSIISWIESLAVNLFSPRRLLLVFFTSVYISRCLRDMKWKL